MMRLTRRQLRMLILEIMTSEHVNEQSATARRGEKRTRFVVRDQVIVTFENGDVDLERSVITIQDVLSGEMTKLRGSDMPITLGGLIEVIDISSERPEFTPGGKRMSSVVARDLATREEFRLPFKRMRGESHSSVEDVDDDSSITYDTNPTWGLPYYGP